MLPGPAPGKSREHGMSVGAQLMAGKKGLIMGLSGERSLAWAIIRALSWHGAEIALTYRNPLRAKRIIPLAESVGSKFVVQCDVSDTDALQAVFDELQRAWGNLDFVVHAIAYADKNGLRGRYVDTTAEAFATALNVSCFSFTAICQRAVKLMPNGGSLLTLTYYGAEKVIPNYNVMGVAKAALETSVRYLSVDLGSANVRVNALSAGPVRTLASAGIRDFRLMLKWMEGTAPLRRNVRVDEIGNAGLYLLSDLSSGVTGEVHHVDCGYHTVGIKPPEAPDVSKVSGGDRGPSR